jgi:GNAT superfamily N-acetyltransferase
VRLGPAALRAQCFPDPAAGMLALCTVDDEVVGHAFAAVWDYDGLQGPHALNATHPHEDAKICWITQLVVRHEYRERGIATSLLRLLPGPDFKVSAFGLASSHPAACLALLKATSTFFAALLSYPLIES